MVKYYAYIFNIFQKYFGNLFGDFKCGGGQTPNSFYTLLLLLFWVEGHKEIPPSSCSGYPFWEWNSASQLKRIYTDTQYIYEIWEIAIEMSLPQKRNSDSKFEWMHWMNLNFVFIKVLS